MKKYNIFVLIILGFVLLGFFIYFSLKNYESPNETPNDDVEVTDTITSKVKVFGIKSGDVIRSPLTIRGEAVGNWFFEASFPVLLEDSTGKDVAISHATASSDWMTTEFVPFSLTLSFSDVETATGYLMLMKDNPSGLPEYDESIRIPVIFGN